MVIKNPQTQRSLQNAVRAACKLLDGEKIFANKFAELCVEMELNQYLPNGMKPILPWTEIDYVCPPKTLFRRLSMKEPERFAFNVGFVEAVMPALLLAMPESIRFEYLNSVWGGVGAHVVSKPDSTGSDELSDVKLPAIKENSELLTALASLPSDASQATDEQLKAIQKEGPEAIEAAQSAVNSASLELGRRNPRLRGVA